MGLYLRLGSYPEVKKTLTHLKAGGLKCAILSNGSPMMVSACIENTSIAHLLDTVLSVEEVKVYEPHPTVYQLGADRLNLKWNLSFFGRFGNIDRCGPTSLFWANTIQTPKHIAQQMQRFVTHSSD